MNTRPAGRVVSARREAEMTTLTDLAPSGRPAAGTRHSGATPDRQQRRSHGRGFWVVGYVFAVTMAFSTIPAPLYVLYQARDHFGALLVTVIFAAYAVGGPAGPVCGARTATAVPGARGADGRRRARAGRPARDRRAPAAPASLPPAAGVGSRRGPPGVLRGGIGHGSRIRAVRAVHLA